MDFLFKVLSDIEKDKLLHFFYGTIIYLIIIFTLIMVAYGKHHYTFTKEEMLADTVVSFFLITLIGIGKEIYDYKHRDKHTPSLRDLVFTLTGPFAISAILVLTIYLIK